MIDLPPDAALVADTPRCRLVPLVVDHAHELFVLLNDQRLHAFAGGTPLGETELVERLRRRQGRRAPDGQEVWLDWVVRLVPMGEAIGEMNAVVTDDGTATISYLIGSRWQGHGFAVEAGQAMVRLLEAHAGVRLLQSLIPVRHRAAQRVAELLGMHPTGRRSAGWEGWEGEVVPVHESIGEAAEAARDQASAG